MIIGRIESLLQEQIDCFHLVVYSNDNVHYSTVIVSDDFLEMTLIKRHRLIYTSLDPIMAEIHALQIQSFTKEEWNTSKLKNRGKNEL